MKTESKILKQKYFHKFEKNFKKKFNNFDIFQKTSFYNSIVKDKITKGLQVTQNHVNMLRFRHLWKF